MSDNPARNANKPTPAEAIALWYSLKRPSGLEVAARFTAAGQPISAKTITRWKKQGWQGVANAPGTDRAAPADAQAIWDSLEKPTYHKVAAAMKAAGKPISHGTIWKWRQAGWSLINAKNAVAKATRAIEKIAAAVPALTGDATSTLSDILKGNNAVTDERHDDERGNDRRSHAECAEHALLSAIRTATAVNDAIHEIAAAVPKAGEAVPKDAPLPMLLAQPEGIARLMMASNAGISVTIEGMRQLPATRAEAAAEVPATQTVYMPGDDYPSRSTIEAIDAALREHRAEQRQVVAQLCGSAQGGMAPEYGASGDEDGQEKYDEG